MFNNWVEKAAAAAVEAAKGSSEDSREQEDAAKKAIERLIDDPLLGSCVGSICNASADIRMVGGLQPGKRRQIDQPDAEKDEQHS